MTQKRYRAVPLENLYAESLDTAVILAPTDLAAGAQAKLHFGPDIPSVLWEGDRRVLTHQSLADLMRTRVMRAPSSVDRDSPSGSSAASKE